jgi:hypothetical protein
MIPENASLMSICCRPNLATHRHLISKRYYLTALEFYGELCEDGVDLGFLREFFANPKNFVSEQDDPDELDNAPPQREWMGFMSHAVSHRRVAVLPRSGFGTDYEWNTTGTRGPTSDSVSFEDSCADEVYSKLSASEQAEALREKDEYIAGDL